MIFKNAQERSLWIDLIKNSNTFEFADAAIDALRKREPEKQIESYRIYLPEIPDFTSKINVIKAIRETTGLGLQESKLLMDSAPVFVTGELEWSEAITFQQTFVSRGVRVEIQKA